MSDGTPLDPDELHLWRELQQVTGNASVSIVCVRKGRAARMEALRGEPIWGTYPCHECGTDLPRYRRCGHWNLDANAWAHLRTHAHTRTPLAMDGALWIGHRNQIIRGRHS